MKGKMIKGICIFFLNLVARLPGQQRSSNLLRSIVYVTGNDVENLSACDVENSLMVKDDSR